MSLRMTTRYFDKDGKFLFEEPECDRPAKVGDTVHGHHPTYLVTDVRVEDDEVQAATVETLQ